MFTLAAVSGTTVTEGFRLHESWEGREHSFYHRQHSVDGLRPGAVYVYPTHWRKLPQPNYTRHWNRGTPGSSAAGVEPLNCRRWALQERELSSRRLYFSSEGISWECKDGYWNNELPWGSDFMPFTSANISDRRAKPGETPEIIWQNIIEDYSSMQLTKEEDMLPALSGVAWKLSRKFKCDYAAGIWTEHGLWGILWRASRLWPVETTQGKRCSKLVLGFRDRSN